MDIAEETSKEQGLEGSAATGEEESIEFLRSDSLKIKEKDMKKENKLKGQSCAVCQTPSTSTLILMLCSKCVLLL